jgi:hypothetical protein
MSPGKRVAVSPLLEHGADLNTRWGSYEPASILHELRIGRHDPVVAMTMHSRGRDELGESVEELEGRERQLGTAMDVGFREAVEGAALG